MNDLQDLFTRLLEYKMRLNLAKYIFEVSIDIFLSYMMRYKGIGACTDQVRAITEMPLPRTNKEI